ncbi:hypothetical protein E2320_018016, partial [Naja naja]
FMQTSAPSCLCCWGRGLLPRGSVWWEVCLHLPLADRPSARASQRPCPAKGADSLSLSCSGHVAALNMLHRQKPLHTVPFFWTKLQSKSIRYA